MIDEQMKENNQDKVCLVLSKIHVPGEESSGDEPDERMENICGALYDWMEIVGNSLDDV